MNQYALFHSIESAYSFPLSQDELLLRVRVDKNDDISHCYLLYNAKHRFFLKRKKLELARKYEDDLYAYYEAKLIVKEHSVAYVFRFDSEGRHYFYSCDGLTEQYDFAVSYYNFFQHAFINEADVMKEVSWAKDAVVYEIFVDRFYRSKDDKNGDYINLKWGDIPNPHSFAGGSLNGIREKLHYLKRLGVNTLYLTPIFEADSNHKYDTKDYYKIDDEFGSSIAFRQLVDEIHKLKMRIVLDGVFNHISSKSDIFLDVAKNGKNSKYYDWFIIYDDDLGKGLYEKFASCLYMPKLNTSKKEVQDFICEIGRYYVKEYQIDGWRLDVSDEISHDLWKRFRKEIKEMNPDVLLIGENWQDASPYLRGDEFDGIMNYSFTRYVNDYLSFNKLDSEGLKNKLENLRLRYINQATNMSWNLLDSHDTYRFFTQVNKNKNRALLGAAIQMFYQGTPCLYYGDELPLEGGYDPDCRRCMDFKKANGKNEFFQMYRELVQLRNKSPIIKYGELVLRTENGLLVFERIYKKQKIDLIINMTGHGQTIKPGSVILANRFEGNVLDNEGFMIQHE